MINFTTDNIEILRAVPWGGAGRWLIAFGSRNAGMHHQLYVDGRLADWSDSPGQREFCVDSASAPRSIVIAAVTAVCRCVDMSGFLGGEFRPAWIYRASVVPDTRGGDGDKLEIFDDHATGEFDTTPDLVADAWSAGVARWAWGQDEFGRGGFGYDGSAAPGLGKGGFGAGMFGLDILLVDISLPAAEEGLHRIKIRTIGPDGQSADADLQQFEAHPPPAPPADLAAESYDCQTHTLTLVWTRSL